MSFRVAHETADAVVVEAQVGPALHNPAKVLHGGVLAGLADSAMGHLMMQRLGPGQTTTNVDLSLRFMRATTAGTLQATSRIVRSGRRVCFLEADVADAQGRTVARATATFLILPVD